MQSELKSNKSLSGIRQVDNISSQTQDYKVGKLTKTTVQREAMDKTRENTDNLPSLWKIIPPVLAGLASKLCIKGNTYV